MRTKDYINAGARAAMDYLGTMDTDRSKAYEYIDDLLEIRRLNRRSSAAWIRGNNSGDAETYKREDNKSDRAWNKANAIAKRRGWKIDAPGLWWIVRNGNNDITIMED